MNFFKHREKPRSRKAQGKGAVGSGNYVGDSLNFTSAEAYKLLRTNLMFSFTEEADARIIGVTSAFRGEGKSLTSINLAYNLAQAGHKVLLLECDLRLPSIPKILNINHTPGLVDCLAGGRSPFADVVQKFPGAGVGFDIITSGTIPPNPSELLGSTRMASLIREMGQKYQYIVVDLPPVSMVADPLVMSKMMDGYIIVARHNYCERTALRNTVRQLEYVNAKIFGFVYNGVSNNDRHYGRKYGAKYKDYTNGEEG